MVPGKLAASLTMLLVVASIGIASAEEVPACPGNPHALGVSRIIEVDTAGGPRLGTYQYPTTLDLGPK
jgi:hypothetical protein